MTCPLANHIFRMHSTAQQEAQRAQFTVENAKQERAQSIVKAEGVAKSAELIGM